MARRKHLIAGNWKMNISSNDVSGLLEEIIGEIHNISKVDVLVCPPFTSIPKAQSLLAESNNILLGAQNLYPEKNGAYTGEISAVMLRELGVSHVILGHSERRMIFKEDDAFINKKVKYAISNNLIPILCVGESIEQRSANKHFDIIEEQVKGCLRDVSAKEAEKIVIAYEPVWAIGTGETATAETAQTMHAFIRGLLEDLFGPKIAESTKLLYGGSLKASNAEELLKENDIDGGLIGGASLKALEFCKIMHIANELEK